MSLLSSFPHFLLIQASRLSTRPPHISNLVSDFQRNIQHNLDQNGPRLHLSLHLNINLDHSWSVMKNYILHFKPHSIFYGEHEQWEKLKSVSHKHVCNSSIIKNTAHLMTGLLLYFQTNWNFEINRFKCELFKMV